MRAVVTETFQNKKGNPSSVSSQILDLLEEGKIFTCKVSLQIFYC